MGFVHSYYDGELRCTSVHEKTGDRLSTDAPKDNQGKGETFSPTDLLATSLATCILTVMAIKARNHGFEIGDMEARTEKIMSSNPRRVAELKIEVSFTTPIPADYKSILERVARECPVALSLSDSLKQQISFTYLPQDKLKD